MDYLKKDEKIKEDEFPASIETGSGFKAIGEDDPGVSEVDLPDSVDDVEENMFPSA
jgi:hypothetical protein